MPSFRRRAGAKDAGSPRYQQHPCAHAGTAMTRVIVAGLLLATAAAQAEPGIDPPVLIKRVEADYPAAAREAHLAGVVTLELLIDAQGAVQDARIKKSAGREFDEAAVRAARALGFQPARKAGRPLAVRIEYVTEFVPEPPAGRAAQVYALTVRGSLASVPREDAAADSSVITADRTPRAGESVVQLLSQLPGVSVNRTGGIGSLATISLRGSTWDQVGVYVDGVPLNSGVQGGVDISTLPLGDIDRIEVYRGATPIAFGTSALGGIVSVTTREPLTTSVTGELGVGSFDTETAGLSAAWVGNRVRVYAGAHYLSSVGNFFFTSDNGTPFDTSQDHTVERTNNAVSEADGVARVVVPLAHDRTLSFSLLAYSRDQGLPGYGSVRQTTETSLSQLRLAGSATYEAPGELESSLRLRAQAYLLYGDQKYKDPLGEISIVPENTNDQTWTAGATLRLSRRLVQWLLLSGVLDLRDEQYEPFDADAHPSQGATASRLFVGAGAEADFWWERLRLHVIPSLRVEAINDARGGLDDDTAQEIQHTTALAQAAPIARLALLEQFTERASLRANAGRYVRFPSLYELYGNSGFVIGNPALVPESGWTADLGAQARVGSSQLSATFDASLFGSLVDDLIQFQQDAYGRARALNIGQARILGVEASVDARLTRYALLRIDGTFIDPRDVSDTSLGRLMPILPNQPRFHVYARPEGRLPIGTNFVLGAYVELDLTDGNYLDPANLVALPGRTLLGAGLYADATPLGLRIVASAQNLTDARTFDFAGFPLPSRSFFITARYTFTPGKTL